MNYWFNPSTGEYTQADWDLEPYGYVIVTQRPEPHPEIYTWDLTANAWVIQEQFAKTSIANERYEREAASIVYNGKSFLTDDRSKTHLNGAAIKCMRDPDHTVLWKTASGEFVSLNAAAVLALHDAVIAHVEGCFVRESELLAALSAGTLTAAMIDTGWPENAA